jgi:N-acetylneuraminate synthase/N,N'-diacetyllegionaminate synthase
LPGPDHSFAIEPDELSEMVHKIREVEAAIGDGIKDGPSAEEREMYIQGRRSLHTKHSVSAGETITRDNICIKRPGYGILPRLSEKVIGMVVTKDIPEDHWISWEDLK